LRTAVVLFTRDLRVRDNPALAAAVARADTVVPLFVADPTLMPRPATSLYSISAAANRHRFLAESLGDLRQSLRQRGGDLIIRRGDPVDEAVRLAHEVGAGAITVAADVSRYAHRRERRLRDACAEQRLALDILPGLTVVPAGELRPGGGKPAYRVFTPYWRVWREHRWRQAAPTPRKIKLPPGVHPGELPEPPTSGLSPDVPAGGEQEIGRAHV
jgi:deoxyribodipyrimidine photo-lyase